MYGTHNEKKELEKFNTQRIIKGRRQRETVSNLLNEFVWMVSRKRMKGMVKEQKKRNEIVKSQNLLCPFWTWHMKKKDYHFMSDNQVIIVDCGTCSS